MTLEATTCLLNPEINSITFFRFGIGLLAFPLFLLYFIYLCLMDQIDLYRSRLIALCELHKVQQFYLFGSILSTRFNESSDVDVLVQFGKIELMEYFDNYMDFKEKLEELFQRPVDLVENQAIRNPIFRKVIDREKLLVYERKSA